MPPCKEEDTKGSANVWLMDEPVLLVSELHHANNAARTNPLVQDTAVDSQGDKSKNLWWIHGNGYELQDFVERHPGGREAILLGKGRDCTALVESYHAFSSAHHKILEKYLVEERNKKAPQVDFFYSLLKERVMVELKAQGLDPQADRGAGWGRTMYYGIVLLAWLATGYLHAVQGSILGSFLFAWAGWFMGALGHDSGHFAASHRYPIINEWGVWAMGLICNPVMWQHQHTYGHHSFTNEFSRDPDLHHLDRFLRVHRRTEHCSIYEKQRQLWYVVVCYLLVVFGTCLKIPLDMMVDGHLNGIVEWQDQDRWSKRLGMGLHLALYLAVIVVAPFFAHSSAPSAAVAGVLHIATLGSIFGYFSQINHLNEASLEADMETKSNKNNQEQSTRRDPRLANSWAVAQVETSNNFAPHSLLWHFVSNGLNLQIEHHLFPGLNHGHLHLIAPVVRKTCEEYGVQYKCYDSWIDVMKIHLAWYKKLSYVPTASKE